MAYLGARGIGWEKSELLAPLRLDGQRDKKKREYILRFGYGIFSRKGTGCFLDGVACFLAMR
jgi:hypothetical protein